MSRYNKRRIRIAPRTGPATGIAVGLALILASSATAATVTIGAPNVNSIQGAEFCSGTSACNRTLMQFTQPTLGVNLVAPADGVITSWQVHGYTNAGSLALRVVRREPDGRFTGVATGPPVTASPTDGNPSHAVNIPIQAGDYIGVDLILPASTSPAALAGVYYTLPGGASFNAWDGALPEGITGAASRTPPGRLMLNAVEGLKPVVTAVAPSSGSTRGGEGVTITGTNLDGATGVSFGGTPAATFTASATQITATAPARGEGTIHVQVTGPGGQSQPTSADIYSYVGPSGAGGTPGKPGAPGSTGPINVFSFAGTSSLGSGNATLRLTLPGAGSVAVVDAGPAVTKAARKKSKRKGPVALFGSVSARARTAGDLTLTLKPTAAGRTLLARGKSFTRLARVTFTPTGGRSASKTTPVRFARRAKR